MLLFRDRRIIEYKLRMLYKTQVFISTAGELTKDNNRELNPFCGFDDLLVLAIFLDSVLPVLDNLL